MAVGSRLRAWVAAGWKHVDDGLILDGLWILKFVLRLAYWILVRILRLIFHSVLRFRLNLFLLILCIGRVLLTIYPQCDIEVVPQVPVICEYLSIKLNDIVVVGIWILIPILCGRSIVGQYGVLGLTSFRDLFFDIFSSENIQVKRPMPILAVFLTGISATYTPRLVYIIYTKWTVSFNPLVQTLQVYPALMMVIQTLYQGTFLLRAYSQPTSLSNFTQRNLNECKKQLEANIILNTTLFLHCVCIVAVVEGCSIEKDIFLPLAGGEMLYRLWAIVAFLHLRKRIELCSHDTGGRSEDETATKSVTIVDHTHVHSSVTSPPLKNDSATTDSTGKDALPMTTPSKTISEDTNSRINDFEDATTPVDSDKNYELKNSKMVLLSSCKELQQSFEASRDEDYVSPQQCTDKPSRDSCELVVTVPPTTPNFS